MSKKMMLLALSVVSAALFALPAVASATPAHIELPSKRTFTVHAGEGSLSTTSGETVKCTTTTGGGELEPGGTTGSFTLKFHGCTAETIFGKLSCTSHPEPTETIVTTKLPFHLFSPGKAGENGTILVTPSTGTSNFAHFTCAGLNKVVTGTGLVGTIEAPTCDTSSSTATLEFTALGHGVKAHDTITGVKYTFDSNGTTAAMDTTPTVTFNEQGFYNCTP